MQGEDLKRVSRLTAILTQLQTKRSLAATSLSEKFGVSTRTIYRDIKALDERVHYLCIRQKFWPPPTILILSRNYHLNESERNYKSI